MKTLVKTITFSTLLVCTTLSFAAPKEEGARPGAGMREDCWHDDMHGMGMHHGNMHGGMMMNMMDHEHMVAMHQNMRQMHETMNKLMTEKDPQKRQALMQEHLAQMSQGAHMMNMWAADDKTMGSEDMDNLMHMMREHMDMMTKMMEQIQQHQTEAKKRHGMPMQDK